MAKIVTLCRGDGWRVIVLSTHYGLVQITNFYSKYSSSNHSLLALLTHGRHFKDSRWAGIGEGSTRDGRATLK